MNPDYLAPEIAVPVAFVLWPWLILTTVRYVRNLNNQEKDS